MKLVNDESIFFQNVMVREVENFSSIFRLLESSSRISTLDMEPIEQMGTNIPVFAQACGILYVYCITAQYDSNSHT